MKVHVDVSSIDTATALMASMPGKCARARNSALSTIGFNLKNAAKQAIKDNTLGWPKLSLLTVASKMYKKDGTVRTQYNTGAQASKIWGSLGGILAYKVDKDKGLLDFGIMVGTYGKRLAYTNKPLNADGTSVNGSWGTNQGKKMYVANVITETIASLARKLTVGFENVIVTSRQQRYFFVLGQLTGLPFIFKIGTRFKIPARPLIGPVVTANRHNIPEWFYDKFWERMRHYEGLS